MMNDEWRMMKIKVWPLLFACLLAVAAAIAQDENVQSLVKTEEEFAATSVRLGMRNAFLMYLADDSVLFRPGPVPGKPWMENHPPRGGILSWEPTLAEAASDLGYTSGPWEFREKSPNDRPSAYGYFVTVWKKQTDGNWKVVLDTGTTNPPPAAAEALSFPSSGAAPAAKTDLTKTETDFCAALSTKGVGAFDSFGADSIRLLRDDTAPLIGKQAVIAAGRTASCAPAKVFISSDGILGYSYGAYQNPQEKGNYVRIWKQQRDGWKILIDVSTPD